jgi:hypothetical protein
MLMAASWEHCNYAGDCDHWQYCFALASGAKTFFGLVSVQPSNDLCRIVVELK